VTTRDINKSRDALMEILGDIAGHADQQASERCPYRNKHDQCTAKFSCRNQRPTEPDPAVQLCGHDGPFDYRSAWDSNPKLHEKALRDIAKIKSTDKS
jgi:hypothetical protein